MRKSFVFILLIAALNSNSQIKVPSGFVYVKGDSPSGRLDYFKNGQFILSTDAPFQSDNFTETDQGIKNHLKSMYGVTFNKTSDGLYYGTGFSDQQFKYIVIVQNFAYLLTAKSNDKSFSDYSTWLLKALRKALAQNKEIYFE